MAKKKKKEAPAEQEIPAEVAQEAGMVANGPPPQEEKPHPELNHELTAAEWAHYQAIKDAHLRVYDLQLKYDHKNSKAKEAKKELELAFTELSNLIAEGPQRPDPQKKLPFEEGGTADQKPSHHDTDETQAKIEEATKVDWQKTPITEILTLTPKQRERLEDAGIWTIGQFEHVRGGRNRDYPDGLRSIKGIGEKSVDKWEDDVVNWLSVNAREPEPSAKEKASA